MIVRRLGSSDDLSGAIDLLQRFFREEAFDTPDEAIACNTALMAANSNCAIILAETEGQAVGVATLSMEFGIEFGWSGEMGDLYVLPEWRGRGLARRLAEAVEGVLRERGGAGYQVTVTPHGEENHGLSRFYAALGFDGEGRRILFKALP